MDSRVVRCSSCGQANRISEPAAGSKVVCGKCKTPLVLTDGGTPVVLTDASLQEAIVSGKPLLVDFWAAWCGPCRTIAPVIEALARDRMDITFGKLNVDENRQSSARFGISGIPTMILFSGGVEKGRVVGAVGRRELEQAINQHLGP